MCGVGFVRCVICGYVGHILLAGTYTGLWQRRMGLYAHEDEVCEGGKWRPCESKGRLYGFEKQGIWSGDCRLGIDKFLNKDEIRFEGIRENYVESLNGNKISLKINNNGC